MFDDLYKSGENSLDEELRHIEETLRHLNSIEKREEEEFVKSTPSDLGAVANPTQQQVTAQDDPTSTQRRRRKLPQLPGSTTKSASVTPVQSPDRDPRDRGGQQQ